VAEADADANTFAHAKSVAIPNADTDRKPNAFAKSVSEGVAYAASYTDAARIVVAGDFDDGVAYAASYTDAARIVVAGHFDDGVASGAGDADAACIDAAACTSGVIECYEYTERGIDNARIDEYAVIDPARNGNRSGASVRLADECASRNLLRNAKL